MNKKIATQLWEARAPSRAVFDALVENSVSYKGSHTYSMGVRPAHKNIEVFREGAKNGNRGGRAPQTFPFAPCN